VVLAAAGVAAAASVAVVVMADAWATPLRMLPSFG
jgi:hypothetical protein